MKQKCKIAFLALVVLQALHSVEEYVFEFYEVFRPARFLDDLWPGIAQPGFIVFNVALVLFGLWCFFRRIDPDAGNARLWAWLWVAIELYNGVAHVIWAVAILGYNPGLATAPFLFSIAGYLAVALRAETRLVATGSAAPGGHEAADR